MNESSHSNLLLVNANVITLDPLRPRAEKIAIRDGLILGVDGRGDTDMLYFERCPIYDCRGMTVLPGFHDAHCHLHAFAESLVGIDISPSDGIRSIEDIQAAVREHSLKTAPGSWIRGGGYNEFYLAEKRVTD